MDDRGLRNLAVDPEKGDRPVERQWPAFVQWPDVVPLLDADPSRDVVLLLGAAPLPVVDLHWDAGRREDVAALRDVARQRGAALPMGGWVLAGLLRGG